MPEMRRGNLAESKGRGVRGGGDSSKKKSSVGKNVNIEVYIRVRPLSQTEKSRNEKCVWEVDRNTVRISSSAAKRNELQDSKYAAFAFDHVGGPEVKTQEIYDRVVKSKVSNFMSGINATIMAYGQTSSGKTFTMMGNQKSPGINKMVVQDVFRLVENAGGKKYSFFVSYIEIYNEDIFDLLGPKDGHSRPLRLRENNKGVYIESLTRRQVINHGDILKYIDEGEQLRHVGYTMMNRESSRSHTILSIRATCRDGRSVAESVFNMVDLAGSERMSVHAWDTTAQGSATKRKEGGCINKSLYFLGNVIEKLASKSTGSKHAHVPYRNSKLTRILQESLGGNSRTIIICCMTPSSMHNVETISTLKFANTAKKIQNVAKENRVRIHKGMKLPKFAHSMTTPRMNKFLDETSASLALAHSLPEAKMVREAFDFLQKLVTIMDTTEKERITNRSALTHLSERMQSNKDAKQQLEKRSKTIRELEQRVNEAKTENAKLTSRQAELVGRHAEVKRQSATQEEALQKQIYELTMFFKTALEEKEDSLIRQSVESAQAADAQALRLAAVQQAMQASQTQNETFRAQIKMKQDEIEAAIVRTNESSKRIDDLEKAAKRNSAELATVKESLEVAQQTTRASQKQSELLRKQIVTKQERIEVAIVRETEDSKKINRLEGAAIKMSEKLAALKESLKLCDSRRAEAEVKLEELRGRLEKETKMSRDRIQRLEEDINAGLNREEQKIQQMTGMEAEIRKKSAGIEVLQKSLSEALKAKANVDAKYGELKSEIHKLEEDIKTGLAREEQKSQQIVGLEMKINSQKADIDALKNSVSDANKAKAEADIKCEALNSEVQNLNQSLEEERKEREEKLKKLEGNLEWATAAGSKLSDVNRELREYISKVETDLEEKEDKLEKAEERIERRNVEISKLSRRRKLAEKGLVAADKKIKDIEKFSRDLSQQLREKENSVQALNNELTEVKKSTAGKIVELEDEISSAQKKLRDEEEKHRVETKASERQLMEKSANYDAATERVNTLEATLVQKESTLSEFKSKLAAYESLVREKEDELHVAKAAQLASEDEKERMLAAVQRQLREEKEKHRAESQANEQLRIEEGVQYKAIVEKVDQLKGALETRENRLKELESKLEERDVAVSEKDEEIKFVESARLASEDQVSKLEITVMKKSDDLKEKDLLLQASKVKAQELEKKQAVSETRIVQLQEWLKDRDAALQEAVSQKQAVLQGSQTDAADFKKRLATSEDHKQQLQIDLKSKDEALKKALENLRVLEEKQAIEHQARRERAKLKAEHFAKIKEALSMSEVSMREETQRSAEHQAHNEELKRQLEQVKADLIDMEAKKDAQEAIAEKAQAEVERYIKRILSDTEMIQKLHNELNHAASKELRETIGKKQVNELEEDLKRSQKSVVQLEKKLRDSLQKQREQERALEKAKKKKHDLKKRLAWYKSQFESREGDFDAIKDSQLHSLRRNKELNSRMHKLESQKRAAEVKRQDALSQLSFAKQLLEFGSAVPAQSNKANSSLISPVGSPTTN